MGFKYDEKLRIWYKGNEPPLFVYFLKFSDIPVTAKNWKNSRPTYGSCAIVTQLNDDLVPNYNIVYQYRAPWFNDIEQFDKSRLKSNFSHQLKNW